MTTNTGAHYLSLLLIAAFLICLAGAAWWISDMLNHWPGPEWTPVTIHAVTTPDYSPAPALQFPPVCFEDMPCWNCETMGNLTCGLEIEQ